MKVKKTLIRTPLDPLWPWEMIVVAAASVWQHWLTVILLEVGLMRRSIKQTFASHIFITFFYIGNLHVIRKPIQLTLRTENTLSLKLCYTNTTLK